MNEQQSPEQPSPSQSGLPQLILRWLISTLAIFVAVWLVPGIEFQGPGWQLGIVGLCFGFLNVLLRPLAIILTVFTLGLFSLVVNALLLIFTAIVASRLGIQFTVDGFWSAFLGGLIISLVTTILSHLSGDRRIVIHIQRGNHNDPE
jgi:putative membrane protein